MLNMISPIVGSLFKTVDKVIDNKAEGDKIKAKIQEKLLAGELKELEGAAKIIETEAKGGFLQRNWVSKYSISSPYSIEVFFFLCVWWRYIINHFICTSFNISISIF